MEFGPTLFFVLAVVLLATTVRATLGFGDALIAMPLLSMLIGAKTSAPLVALCSATLALAMAVRHRRAIEMKNVWPLLVSATVGIPTGIYLAQQVNERTIKLALAVLVAGFAVYQLWPHKREAEGSWYWAFPLGFFSGLLGGAYNIFGPPIVIFATLRRWTAEQFRATVQSYVLPMVGLVLAVHYQQGHITRTVWVFYFSALPVLLVSFLLGGLFHKRIDEQLFRRIVLGLLIVIGCTLFFNSVR